MTKSLGVLVATLLVTSGSLDSASRASTGASLPDATAVINTYCVTCHNQRLKTGGLALDAIDLRDVGAHAEVLEKVVRKLLLGAMPPQGAPRPDQATYNSLRGVLAAQLDRAATSAPSPGRTEALHRLNRTEYQNAIRDVLDLEGVDIAMMLPVDDASYGFDNMAGILGMSPTHIERYLSAARKISRVAVGDVALAPTIETHKLPVELSQDDQFDNLPFGTRGGTRVRHYFPVDAEYAIRFESVPGVGTGKEPNRVEVSVDGERVFVTEVEQQPPAPTGQQVADDVRQSSEYEVRMPIRGGLHDIDVTYVQATFAQVEDVLQPYLRPPSVSIFRHGRVGGYAGPYVMSVTIAGPFAVSGSGDTPSRRRIFSCRPKTAADEVPCARTIVSSLARRAYRRPVTDSDVTPLIGFYQEGRASGSFDKGIQVALEALLSSADFLFRVSREPANVPAGKPYRVTNLELASRLSFFLWSSGPDAELLDAASRGALRDPAGLEGQVRRMLADHRSDALVTNFAGQWLRLRNLNGVTPDSRLFPDFDDNLRQSFRRETELFFESIMREDRSVVDLLNADYSFVNERLARHYGIPNVYGSRFRRVILQDPRRRGLLGQGSVLTVTSQANRTSPVVRGKFILENVLGAPPPPPPPNVPGLEETRLRGTLRQRMEQHRKNPVCASCHRAMDPLGFALENFDAVGAWRSEDGGRPVDAAGVLPDGTAFTDIVGLRAALVAQPEVFVTTLTEKLLTYALGRGVEYYDAPAVRAIVREAAPRGYRLSSIVLGIVRSVPFQMRQSDPVSTPAQVSGLTGR